MLIHGACHCGNIRFELEWRPEPTGIPARACGCSFCQKHGAAWTACPAGSLLIRVADPGRVTRYDFGTRTAEFHVCTGCGIVPVVTSIIEGRCHAVVNVNTFEGLAVPLVRGTVDFDGEDEGTRLARRARAWIGEVRFRP